MASLNSSKDGRARIQQARKEKGWTIEDPRWLVEASKELERNGNWTEVGPYASGISLPTWRRFLAGKKPIKTDAFKTYCKVLGLNWEEVVDRSSPLPPPPTEDSGSANLIAILRHSNKVSSVTISPDGKILASGCHDGIIRIWSLHSGELLRTLSGHTTPVLFVAISLDGQTLVSRSYGGTIRLWNFYSGELLHILSHNDFKFFSHQTALAISSDCQTLALGHYGGNIDLWNLHTGELLRTLPPPGKDEWKVLSIAISLNGQTLASKYYSGPVVLWNLHTGESLHTQLRGCTPCIAISPDSQTLASLANKREMGDWCINLWNLQSFERFQVIRLSTPVSSPFTISNDGQTLFVGCFDGTIRLWNIDSGELLRTLEGHSASVKSVVISPDGKTLASGSEDGTIRIWKM